MLQFKEPTYLVVTPSDIEALANGYARRGYRNLQIERRFGVAEISLATFHADLNTDDESALPVRTVCNAADALSLVGRSPVILFARDSVETDLIEASDTFEAPPAVPVTIQEMLTNIAEPGSSDLFEAGEMLTSYMPSDESAGQCVQINATLAARWMAEVISFCLGIEEQRRLFREELNIGEDPLRVTELHEAQTAADLEAFARSLESDAISERFTRPIHGREAEIGRVARILSRSRRNNVIVVGEHRIGKSSIIEGFRRKLEAGELSRCLNGAVVKSVNLPELKAAIAATPGLTVIHLTNFFEAGCEDVRQGDVEESWHLPVALLKLLRTGRIRFVVEATPDQMRAMEASAELSHYFDVLSVDRLDPQTIVRIVEDEIDEIAAHHDVVFEDDACARAVELASSHLFTRPAAEAPGEILEEAALIAIEGARTVTGKVIVTRALMRQAAQELSGVRYLAGPERIDEIRHQISSGFSGQDQAIEAVLRGISVAGSGLRRRDKVEGAYLFTGPTGVGKTKLANQIASALGRRLFCWDMAEFSDQHTITRLIGSTRGYYVSRKGGEVTNAIRAYPHGILLFDNFDQAHVSIQKLLLQAVDDARLTDGLGRAADMRGCMIIMTAILQGNAAVNTSLPPELRNRFDEIVHFQSVDRNGIMEVVRYEIDELSRLMEPLGVQLSASEAALNMIAEKGYDPGAGGRALTKYIDTDIKPRIARLLQQAGTGSRIHLDTANGWISVNIA